MSAPNAKNEAAKQARQTMLEARGRGEELFSEMLKKDPKNGMIYFERGIGWEQLGELRLAARDFKQAERLFPLKKCQEIAAEKAKEIDKALTTAAVQVTKDYAPLPDNFPPLLTNQFKTAVDALSGDVKKGCTEARIALEAVVEYELQNCAIAIPPKAILLEKIDLVKSRVSSVSRSIIHHMHTVRVLCNECIHGGRFGREDAQVVKFALHAIASGISSSSHKK